jgi:hypothetical protein
MIISKMIHGDTFVLVLLSCVTFSTGPSGRNTGCDVVEILMPWLFSRPIWVLAATLGPPPVSRDNAPLVHPLTVSSAMSAISFPIYIYSEKPRASANDHTNKCGLSVCWIWQIHKPFGGAVERYAVKRDNEARPDAPFIEPFRCHFAIASWSKMYSSLDTDIVSS